MAAGWRQVPFWCRSILFTTTILYLITLIPNLQSLPLLMTCTPSSIGSKMQLWRLFTGLLVHGSFISLLFSVVSYLPTAMQIE
jgi:membrane associated rhomboid family serine protease